MSEKPDNLQPKLTLSSADASALDAILDPESSPAPATQDSELRTQNLKGWLNVLAAAPVPAPSADLVNRTLAAVQSERMKVTPETIETQRTENENRTSRIETQTSLQWWRRRRWADIAAGLVAASIFVAILIPVISHANYSNRRTICAGNLAVLANALGAYASQESHQLPSLAPSADGNWLYPSPEGHTNTANLLPLVLASINAPAYVPPAKLVCPGRDPSAAAPVITPTSIDGAGYSYTNLFGTVRPTWDGSKETIILADANPLFGPNRTRNTDFNSPNHRRNGNNILHADHSVTWEVSPNVGPRIGSARDNIWTINRNSQRVTTYIGTETPSVITDAFLAP